MSGITYADNPIIFGLAEYSSTGAVESDIISVEGKIVNNGPCLLDCVYKTHTTGEIGEIAAGSVKKFMIDIKVPACAGGNCDVPVYIECIEKPSNTSNESNMCTGRYAEQQQFTFIAVIPSKTSAGGDERGEKTYIQREPLKSTEAAQRVETTKKEKNIFSAGPVIFELPTVISDVVVGERQTLRATMTNNGRCQVQCSYKIQGTNYDEEIITEGLAPGSQIGFNIIFFVPEGCREPCAITAHIKCADKPENCPAPSNYETDISFDVTQILTPAERVLGFVLLGVIVIISLVVVYFVYKFISDTLVKAKAGDDGIKRKLSAIMFTDMKGFSKEMGKNEEETLKKLWRYERPMKAIIREHGGRVVKTMGDAIMGDFDSAVQAVKAAIAIQNLLKKEDIKIRIGIHLGDVIQKAGDLFGDGVNIANRIESICEPGEIYLSEDVYNQVRGKIAINFESLGRKPLKNIDVPPRIYKIRM
jgi:class 3 adenylate cyclase